MFRRSFLFSVTSLFLLPPPDTTTKWEQTNVDGTPARIRRISEAPNSM